MTEFEARAHLQRNLMNGGCTPDEATVLINAFDNARHAEMEKQISEIHAFVTGLAQALNNPVLRAMLPPQLRGVIGE